MTLTFRNVRAAPSDPVRSWPYEALVAAIERGSVSDWARITAQISVDPWGDVARDVEEYLTYSDAYGVVPLLRRALERSRAGAESAEKAEIATQVRDLIERSGLSRAEFASRIGTSRSRLSTYTTGKVTPSASMLLRMSRVAQRSVRA